jgi:glycosyltransferase involved in cell wall biosynthesis
MYPSLIDNRSSVFNTSSDPVSTSVEGFHLPMQRNEFPVISIIVPTFNSMTQNKSIERLLRSVFGQTYKNFEVIIVDNFSTDKTAEICRSLPVVFVQTRTTISQANNVGMDLARGDFLLFLDSDMELPPSFLEDCVRKIRSEGVDCIEMQFNHFPSRKPGLINIVKCRNLEIELGAASFNVYLYSRTIVQGTRFPESEKSLVGEEYIFRMRIISKKPRIGSVETRVFHYYDPSLAWVTTRNWKYGRWFSETTKHLRTKDQIEFIHYNSVVKPESLSRLMGSIRSTPQLLFPFLVYMFVKYVSFGFGYLSF